MQENVKKIMIFFIKQQKENVYKEIVLVKIKLSNTMKVVTVCKTKIVVNYNQNSILEWCLLKIHKYFLV